VAKVILSFESCEELFLPDHIQLHAPPRFDTSIFVERIRNYIKGVMIKPCPAADVTHQIAREIPNGTKDTSRNGVAPNLGAIDAARDLARSEL
jgi:hypothetical protein